MPRRLVLNTVGIKSPLDVRPHDRRTQSGANGRWVGPPANVSQKPGTSRIPRPAARRALTPAPVISEAPHRASAAPKLTSVALDRELAKQLDKTARAAGVPANGLAVAALDARLSARTDTGPRAPSEEEPRPRGEEEQTSPARHRTHFTLSLPERLRARADELSGTVAGRARSAARSDLINEALRDGLPDNPRLALALVIVAATSVPAATR
jgi:hypothetical protein